MFVSKIILVVIFYAIYLLHGSKCKSVYRNMDNEGTDFSLGEFVRHTRTPAAKTMRYCLGRLITQAKRVCEDHGSTIYSGHGKRSSSSSLGSESFGPRDSLRSKCCDNECTDATFLPYCNSLPSQHQSISTSLSYMNNPVVMESSSNDLSSQPQSIFTVPISNKPLKSKALSNLATNLFILLQNVTLSPNEYESNSPVRKESSVNDELSQSQSISTTPTPITKHVKARPLSNIARNLFQFIQNGQLFPSDNESNFPIKAEVSVDGELPLSIFTTPIPINKQVKARALSNIAKNLVNFFQNGPLPPNGYKSNSPIRSKSPVNNELSCREVM